VNFSLKRDYGRPNAEKASMLIGYQQSAFDLNYCYGVLAASDVPMLAGRLEMSDA